MFGRILWYVFPVERGGLSERVDTGNSHHTPPTTSGRQLLAGAGTIVKFYGPIKAAGVLEYLHLPYTGDTPACWKSEEILALPRIPPLKMRETQKKTEIKAGLGGSAAPVTPEHRPPPCRPPSSCPWWPPPPPTRSSSPAPWPSSAAGAVNTQFALATGLTACQLSVLLNYIAIAMVCYFDFMILFSKTRGFKIPLFRFGHFSNPDWQPY